MSAPSPHNDDHARIPDDRGTRRHMADWRPSRRTLLWAAAAFALGLLLFVVLWWRDRGNDFYRPEGTPQTAEGQQFEPLPAPLPAQGPDQNASGLGEPGAAQQPSPGAATIQAPAAPVAPRAPPAPPLPPPEAVAMAPGNQPVPISSPAPGYPPDAFRNGESGTVVLRVHVGADGNPSAVDLVESSHSRSLDRAASEAVKRWRFRPAQRNGQPVEGVVQVPIAFNADH